ncbi:MAG TPA: serine protease [Pirellulaceae bacterium]|nr:serine protease [Pirellulaceae bacterium]
MKQELRSRKLLIGGTVGGACLLLALLVVVGITVLRRTDSDEVVKEQSPSDTPTLAAINKGPLNAQVASRLRQKRDSAIADDSERATEPTSNVMSALSHELPVDELTAHVRRATVLVRLPDAFATAFCVDRKGLFVTDDRFVGEEQTVTLVLDHGEATQRVVTAALVDSEPTLGLALLKVDEDGLTTELPLAQESLLTEADKVVAFGFDGPDRSGDTNVSLRVEHGTIGALRRAGGVLETIQLAANITPHSTGGPVVNSDGEVIGVVRTGILGAELNFLTPVGKLRKLLEPKIEFEPPVVNRSNMEELVEFKVQATSRVDPDEPIELELILTTPDGVARKQQFDLLENEFFAKAVPVPPGAATDTDEVYCVKYSIVSSQRGQVAGRYDGEFTIGPAGTQIIPQRLEHEPARFDLPEPLSDVTVGGRGRWLVLKLLDSKQLAIYDVSVGEIVQHISLKSEPALLAAGLEKLMIVYPRMGTIERWNLTTLSQEASQRVESVANVNAVVMGSGSRGPLLMRSPIRSDVHCRLLDIETLEMDNATIEARLMRSRESVHLRAAANGEVFALFGTKWYWECIALSADNTATPRNRDIVGYSAPGPDGQFIYTGMGVFTNTQEPAGNAPTGMYFVPAHHGGYFLGLPQQKGRLDLMYPPRGPATLYVAGDARPITTLPLLNYFNLAKVDFRSDKPMSFDKRVHIIPEAELIITIPEQNDHLLLHRFRPDETRTANSQDLAALPLGEIGDRAKKATALVVLPSRKGFGSAFCFDERGYFATNHHVVKEVSSTELVTLVLHSGEERQRMIEAKVIRVDPDDDLAILKASQPGELTALRLSDGESADESHEYKLLGFPFGDALRVQAQKFPGVSINVAPISKERVTSLGQEAIEFSTQVNPGNSGGPVISPSGEVIAVVFATLIGGRKSYAIPVQKLRELLAPPHFEFEPPRLTERSVVLPQAFEVRVDSFSNESLEVKMYLKADRNDRELSLRHEDGVFRSDLESMFPDSSNDIQVELTYVEGSVKGVVHDLPLTVGTRKTRLSKIKKLHFKGLTRAVFHDGSLEIGAISGLDGAAINTGESDSTIKCSGAVEGTFGAKAFEAVEYKVLALANGKEVSRLEGSMPVNKEVVGSFGVQATEYALPAEVAEVDAGGSGRWLVLRLPATRQLAIFDVVAGKITHEIPFTDDNVKFAAGLSKLIVVLPNRGEIERWDLMTGKRETFAPIPLDGKILHVGLGCSSDGEMIVNWSVDNPDARPRLQFRYSLIDVQTLQARHPDFRSVYLNVDRIWAAANGEAFGVRSAGGSPGIMALWVLGESVLAHQLPRSQVLDPLAVPAPDGRLFFEGYVSRSGKGTVFDHRGERLVTAPDSGFAIPAHHGSYYLGMQLGPNGRGLAVYEVGDARPILSVPVGDQISSTEGELPVDQRFHLIPKAHLLVNIPHGKKCVLLYRIAIEEALIDRDNGYLLITSQPPLVVDQGDSFRYQMKVDSTASGVRYYLEERPPGMSISAQGLLSWKVPRDFDATEVNVQVSVHNDGGMKRLHSFDLHVVPPRK